MTAVTANDGAYLERQAHALKAALSDLLITALERDSATDRELVSLYASSVMVYACANMRARAVASVPLKLVDGRIGEDVPLTEPSARAFRTGMREVMRRSELTIYFWGRNLLLKRRNAFRVVTNFRWINPTLWTPETSYQQGLIGFRFHQTIPALGPDGRAGTVLSPGEFVYLHTVDFADDLDGVAPAEVAFLDAGLEVEMAQTAVSFFRNRAIPALIIQPAPETATQEGEALQPGKEDVTELTAFMRRSVKGAKNAGRTIIQPVRWETAQLQQNFKDVAMAELSQETRLSIAIASDVPLELVVPTSSSYAQLYDARRGWYEGWVRPQVEWYAEGFTEQVAAEVNPDWQVVPDFDSVAAMKEDAAAKLNRVTGRVNAGLIDLGKAQRELGDDKPDELLNGLYMVGGVPVPREHIREVWKSRFTVQMPELPPSSPVSPLVNKSDQVVQPQLVTVPEADPKLPPQPPSPEERQVGTNGTGIKTAAPLSHSGDPAKAVEELVARMPDALYRELKSWAHVSARKGADYPFEARAIPGDTAAYVRLLLATAVNGLLSPDDLIAAGREDYLKHHLTGQKTYSETALNYRADLLNAVRTAFEEGSLRAAGLPRISRQEFVEQGHARIAVAFRQAFLDGLREGGVNVDAPDEDEERKLTLLIRAEQTYFRNLANDVYDDALPIFLEVLALQDDAKMSGASFEERAAWQRQAVTRYRDFLKVRERIEERIDGYVFKGLEQVHTQGRLSALGNKMQKWVRDPMKASCRSCLALDGQIHRASAFLKVVIPQDSCLLCHGDKCGCGLQDTTERARGRLDRVPLNRGAKGLRTVFHVEAVAAKYAGAGATDIGYYVSFAGEPALVKLRHESAEVMGRVEGIEWVESWDFHLSLAYAAQPQRVATVADLMGRWPDISMTAFPVQVDRLEVWDSPERGRVLVGIVAPSPELATLQAVMADHLAEQGIEIGEQTQPEAFIPHVTLAYGDGLPIEAPVLSGDVSLLIYNVTLATPEQVLQGYGLLAESENERMNAGQEQL